MIKITVPATSANMGPGFDSLGIALNLYNIFYMEEAESIEIITDDDEIPKDHTNLVYICAKKVYDMCNKELSGLKIISECSIPQARGLGSSSACIVAGLLGANALLNNPLSKQDIINLAGTIEGHPDNSTPAILGGFCVAMLENEKVSNVRVPISHKLDFIAFIPNFELKTEHSRSALPKMVSHKDAVFNLSRSALLAGSLVTGDLHNIEVAVKDCLHQPYRFGLIKNGEEICDIAKEFGALGTYISGAGPTIIAMIDASDTLYLSRCQKILKEKYPDWTPYHLKCDEVGALVEIL